MAEKLFGRQVKVTFGQRGSKGVSVSGLRVSFDIKTDKSEMGNDCKVKIYNMNKEHRDILKNEDDMVITLEAGYEKISELYFGDIQYSIPTERVGPDLVTTIEAKTGQKAIRESSFTRTYNAGFGYDKIFDDIKKELVKNGSVNVSFDGKNIVGLEGLSVKNVFVLSGTIESVMNKFFAGPGLEWSVQNKELQVLGPTQTIHEAVQLSPKTGLLGTPKPREKGIEFKALIQSTDLLQPGKPVEIVSETMPGIFKIQKASFKGDTHGPDWFVKVEAE